MQLVGFFPSENVEELLLDIFAVKFIDVIDISCFFISLIRLVLSGYFFFFFFIPTFLYM